MPFRSRRAGAASGAFAGPPSAASSAVVSEISGTTDPEPSGAPLSSPSPEHLLWCPPAIAARGSSPARPRPPPRPSRRRPPAPRLPRLPAPRSPPRPRSTSS